MKKFFTLVVLALLAVGCAKEYDDSGLRELIAGLDLRVSELESSVSALQSTLGDGKFVRKVEEYKDPDTGRTTGVTVTYTDGNIVHFNIVPTDPSQGPVFSVIRNGAGELVWAVDGKAIKLDGEEVPVYQTPVFSIDDEGNLLVEVDGKTTNLGPVKSEGATLQDGIFTNLAVTDDAVVLTLSDGSTVNIPFAEAFKLNIETAEFTFGALEPIEIPYTVSAKTEATVVGVAGYSPKEFKVEVDADKIVITPLSLKAAAVMMAYADSKVGLVSVVNLTVEAEGFEITDAPYSAEYDYLAEGEDAVVVANAVSNISFEVKPVEEWIHVASVKSTAYVITLKLDDNLTGAVREGTVNIVKAGTEEVIQTIKIAQLAAVIEEGPKNLSKKGAANSYIVTEAGEYKFWAVKGNSGETVSPATVEVLWETWNNAEEVTANSVVASVKVEGSYVVFSTPETLKPGNAVIAAKDAAGVILWSWHIWVPASEVATLENGVFSTPMMDRNLGALVVAATGAEAPVESFGLTYQWGRKDPFPGPKAANSSSNAKVAGVELSSTDGAGEADEAKISLEQSIQNPTLLGHSKNGDWLLPADNTLWQDAVKTMYDPCPPGYRVPVLEGNENFFSGDASAAAGWEENKAMYYFAMGNPQSAFPFAGYRDDYDPVGMTHAYDRAVYWSSSASSDAKGAYLNVRAGSAHSKADAGKSRAGSVRCVAADETPILPPNEDTPGGGGSDTPAVDLSETATANCYIVSEAGKYMFKTVQGNSAEPVGAVATAEILWETYNNAEDVVANSVIAEVSYADNYITFSTPATLKAGNALIAAKDANGKILWSWHIWIPKTVPTADFFGLSTSKTMLDRNIGALDAPTKDSDNAENAGFFYQWGRKDPLRAVSSLADGTLVKTAPADVWTTTSTQMAKENMHETPCVFITDNTDWCSTRESTLWTETKTVNDPCPAGYKVPKYGETSLFDYFEIANYAGWSVNEDKHNFTIGDADSYAVFPFGHITRYGKYDLSDSKAWIWTATHKSDSEPDNARAVTVKAVDSRGCSGQRKANGVYVRCIAE